jgi:beta-galactosidase
MAENKGARVRLSMDKGWRFHLGDLSCSDESKHAGAVNLTKAGGIGGPAGADYNDENWQLVDIPHDWAVEQEFSQDEIVNQGYKPRGIGWYRKIFMLDESDKGKQLLLEFDGICTDSRIYFNGSELMHNRSAYNSFVVDISDRAFWGDKPNVLAVRVDATVYEGWWYEGAGIYRHVWLTKKNPVHIAHWGIWVNPQRDSDGKWNTYIETTVENSDYKDEAFTVASTILDPDGNIVGKAEITDICPGGEQIAVKQRVILENPRLWDIDAPNLYTLESQVFKENVLVDDDTTRFGYRTIRVCPDTGFYLNDRNIKIMGTCNHQDHAGVGVALPDSLHYYRIRRLKEMGSNAYRCAHGNPAKELLDACDEMGMLVMDENRRFESSPEVIKQVESMVRRDRNHPCVILYSLCNEEPLQGTAQGRATAKRLIQAIKKLDNTRFITAAMNGGFLEDEGFADVLDITGFNYNIGDYDPFHKKHPRQPMIGSENNCTFSTRGVYFTDNARQIISSYDEEKASWGHTIRETWKAVNTRSYVMGLFVWTGFDYRGEPTPFAWPSINSHWGAMDTCGFPKDGFYLHKACWTKKPMVHILPHWNWEGMEGKPVKVMSHTNCEEVELFLNGRSLGRKTVNIYKQAVWMVEYEPGVLMMKGYVNNEEAAVDIVETSGKAAALRLEADRDFIYGDGLDAMPVNACAVDPEGRFVPFADDKVSFTVTGPGRIIGVGNGDPNSHERDKATSRSLFNGRCQAILQSIQGTGFIIVRAEAAGLKPAELVIRVEPREPVPSVPFVMVQPNELNSQEG